MNKQQLVSHIARKSGLIQDQVRPMLDLILEGMVDALYDNDELKILGFGAFTKQIVKERNGINPRTQEKLIIPAHQKMKFTPGIKMRSAADPNFQPPAQRICLKSLNFKDLAEMFII